MSVEGLCYAGYHGMHVVVVAVVSCGERVMRFNNRVVCCYMLCKRVYAMDCEVHVCCCLYLYRGAYLLRITLLLGTVICGMLVSNTQSV